MYRRLGSKRWTEGEVPGHDESSSTNNLRNPEYAICQTGIVHIDYTGNARDRRDPKDACGEQLNHTGEESNFMPTRTTPKPILRRHSFFSHHFLSAMESMHALGIETVAGVPEAELPLA